MQLPCAVLQSAVRSTAPRLFGPRRKCMPDVTLVPTPKSLQQNPGSFALPSQMFILLDPHAATRDLFAAERFEIEAEALTGTQFRIAVAADAVHPEAEIRVRFDDSIPHEQGYRLTIPPPAIELAAKTPAGTFYAFQTLTQ